MIRVETANSSGKIFKSLADCGLEAQHWNLRNDTGNPKLKLRSAHFHDEFQIGFSAEGHLENTRRGAKEIIAPDRLYFIQPGETHAENALTADVLRLHFVFISERLMNEITAESANRKQSGVSFTNFTIENKRLNRLLLGKFKALVSSIESGGSKLEQTGNLFDFIECAASKPIVDSSETRKKGGEKKAVKVVKEYLSENLSENISLDTLSQKTHVSKFHLLRQFKLETGLTVHRYLVQLRICRAKEFLKSGKSISETAFELGFNDQAHFSKSFKRFTSQTPGQFYNPKTFFIRE